MLFLSIFRAVIIRNVSAFVVTKCVCDDPFTVLIKLSHFSDHSKHEVNALKFLRDEVDKFSIDKQVRYIILCL